MVRRRLCGCAAVIGGLVLLWAGARPASAYRVEWAGRRLDLGMSLTAREVLEENRSTQHERTLGKARFTPRLEWSRSVRFAASISGYVGGPTMLAQRGGVLHWRKVFQNLSPAVDFEEFYLDGSYGPWDVRLGKQRIAWGKLDRFSPVDVWNTLAYFDPFLLEESERKLATPALTAAYSVPQPPGLDDLRVQVAWVPLYLPYRFPDARCDFSESGKSVCRSERWFPQAAVPPPIFVIPAGLLPAPGGGRSPEVAVPLAFRVRNEAPRATLRDGSFGARVSATVRGVDSAAYYFHGYDIQPAFLFEAWATGQPDPNPNNPLHVTSLTGRTFLSPVFKTIDLWGLDLAHSRGPFVFRVEGAFVSGRPYAREIRSLLAASPAFAAEVVRALGDLARGAGATKVSLPASFVTRDGFEWGVGADYQHRGWTFIAQANQTALLKSAKAANLLIQDVDTRLFLTVRRNFLSERLQANFLGGYGIDSSYTFTRPRLRYRWNDWLWSEVGYLFIAGRRQSVIGQYRRNDEGWVSVSVQF
ncbi:MAG: hypothetical protein KatS3mg077_3110 [Candidatus Binatia bacterium]|nr:MAG: hypothetical protein KatS3mg077_3110 [Candidatus Binatia bacterium]